MVRKTSRVMLKLIGLIKPLLLIMLFAISLGVLGYLCAMFITIVGAIAIVKLLGYDVSLSLNVMLLLMVLFGALRGFLRYGEQASNHYIAFKILALIRSKVFAKLRELSPAKLEEKDKGNLISIITSDIELLEVFYAHTISPIAIAIIVSIIMIIFIGQYHIVLAVIAGSAYFFIGCILPVFFNKKGGSIGQTFRDDFGNMNSFILDSLRGINESIQFKHGKKRLNQINQRSDALEEQQFRLKKFEAQNKAINDAFVLSFSLMMLVAAILLFKEGWMTIEGVIISSVAILSSFGPVVALSALSNNLYHTIASGNRVLDLLEEKPIVYDIENQEKGIFGDIHVENISFGYEQEEIISNMSLSIPKHKIIGIHGKSGSGKSTILKLLMRFWKVDQGTISINSRDIESINTSDLRTMEAYVTQDTYLFHDSIANNIALGKDVPIEEIQEAAKKASIHSFIMELPNGYDTKVGELGSTLSGGEKQRIGVARAFLHNANVILLDEPTSNLDSLNEAIILESLKNESEQKTIILVTHRKSTISIVDTIYQMDEFRVS